MEIVDILIRMRAAIAAARSLPFIREAFEATSPDPAARDRALGHLETMSTFLVAFDERFPGRWPAVMMRLADGADREPARSEPATSPVFRLLHLLGPAVVAARHYRDARATSVDEVELAFGAMATFLVAFDEQYPVPTAPAGLGAAILQRLPVDDVVGVVDNIALADYMTVDALEQELGALGAGLEPRIPLWFAAKPGDPPVVLDHAGQLASDETYETYDPMAPDYAGQAAERFARHGHRHVWVIDRRRARTDAAYAQGALDAVLAERGALGDIIDRLRAELDAAHDARIEAQNPGIDLADVRARRAAARAAAAKAGARCEEPAGGCGWWGLMSDLRREPHGVTHCPSCDSTAIVEDIAAPASRHSVNLADEQQFSGNDLIDALAGVGDHHLPTVWARAVRAFGRYGTPHVDEATVARLIWCAAAARKARAQVPAALERQRQLASAGASIGDWTDARVGVPSPAPVAWMLAGPERDPIFWPASEKPDEVPGELVSLYDLESAARLFADLAHHDRGIVFQLALEWALAREALFTYPGHDESRRDQLRAAVDAAAETLADNVTARGGG